MRHVAGLTLVLVLGGCGGTAPSVPSVPPAVAPSGPTAAQVVDAFVAGGLPVVDRRDTSPQCSELPGCVERVTSESISVLRFETEAQATQYEVAFGDGAHRAGLLVLSYAAARTPEEDRPEYEAVLTELLGR